MGVESTDSGPGVSPGLLPTGRVTALTALCLSFLECPKGLMQNLTQDCREGYRSTDVLITYDRAWCIVGAQ